ncbi:hypothetical protein [Actinopolyspora halophila]|uniref:hypothetical protein n=1 Tax=Actinopolyspora halophila TaxID=1850 RepID=UPI0012F8C956|nr:hypothetical protein [Actinopolyspora halophila]
MHPENESPSPSPALEHTTTPTRWIPRQSSYHFSDTSTLWELEEQEDNHLVRGYD